MDQSVKVLDVQVWGLAFEFLPFTSKLNMVPCACNLILRWQRWVDSRSSLASQPIWNRRASCFVIGPVAREWGRAVDVLLWPPHHMWRGSIPEQEQLKHSSITRSSHQHEWQSVTSGAPPAAGLAAAEQTGRRLLQAGLSISSAALALYIPLRGRAFISGIS